jgi:hypothetical protein
MSLITWTRRSTKIKNYSPFQREITERSVGGGQYHSHNEILDSDGKKEFVKSFINPIN